MWRSGVRSRKRLERFRRYADWEFIESLPPWLRVALLYYIETGDIRRAAFFARFDIEDFRGL